MLKATKDKLLPTAIIGSVPRPSWYTENLHGRSFTEAMGDSAYREQYARGGMSSGMISLDAWRQRLMPMLAERARTRLPNWP